MRNVLQDQYNPFIVYQLSNGFSHSSNSDNAMEKKISPKASGDAFKTLLDAQMKRLS